MLKKMMMLAVAVAALVALPSAAMGAWTDGTVNVGTNANVEFKGKAKFSSGFLGSIECSSVATTTLEPGTTGKVNTFGVDGSATNCVTGGALAGCQVHSVQSTGLPWVAHTDGAKINITNGEIHNSLTGGFCITNSVTVTGGTVTLTPTNTHAGTQGALGGSLEVHVAGLGSAATTISGNQVIQAPNSGTYGIT